MVGAKIKKKSKKISTSSKKIIFDSRSFRSKVSQFQSKTSRKRGRPRKPIWFHWRAKSISQFSKIARQYRGWRAQWSAKRMRLRRFFGLTKGRGRPRKPISPMVSIRVVRDAKIRAFHTWYQRGVHPLQVVLHRVLQLLRVRRKRGRPKKRQQKRHIFLTEVFPIVRFRWKNIFTTLFFFSVAYGLWWGYQFVFAGLPSVLELTQKDPFLTTKIVDRNGKLLFRVYEDENRTLVPLSAISQHLIDATIAIEDKDFYTHFGFSMSGIMRAAWANLQGEAIQQGGSTITQQLVKNRLLTPERTIQRKLRELVLSVIAEGVYSKEEILEMYLNQVAYGGSTYGAEEASWRYFHKSARNLSLAEAALLAGLPQAPSVYSPFGSTPELAYARQEEVLRRMTEEGFITQEQMQEAVETPIVFAEDRTDIQAPHFVMYVKRLLAEKFGESMVQTGGLEVRTTLDLDVQKAAEHILREELQRLAPLRVGNGAILVTNPRTGEILAMVGSRDYFDFAHDGQVNVVLRPRQPGSSIKPLTYALALEGGLTPNTIIEDSPVVYQVAGSPPYAPKNYDGTFHGRVTLREALASSYNVPAVKTLAGLGVNALLDRGEDAGITTWRDRSRCGL